MDQNTTGGSGGDFGGQGTSIETARILKLAMRTEKGALEVAEVQDVMKNAIDYALNGMAQTKSLMSALTRKFVRVYDKAQLLEAELMDKNRVIAMTTERANEFITKNYEESRRHDGELTTLREQHAAELTTLREQHAAELATVTEQLKRSEEYRKGEDAGLTKLVEKTMAWNDKLAKRASGNSAQLD